jgi:hypothetical protein
MIYNKVILSSSLIGSILLIATSLNGLNKGLLHNKTPPKIFYIINGLIICASSLTFVYCLHLSTNKLN